jgi:beta-galactosidase
MDTREIDLSGGWEFVRGKASEAWLAGELSSPGTELVDLPHCWNTRDTFQDGLAYYRGYGCYRKRVELPEHPAGTWHLDIGPFYGGVEIRVNGRRIPGRQGTRGMKASPFNRSEGAFLGFTTGIQPGDRELNLGLVVENLHHASRLPGIREPDFVLHGGLAGHLKLRPEWQPHLQPGRLTISTRKDGLVSVKLPFTTYREENRPIDGRIRILRKQQVLAEINIPEDLQEEASIEARVDQPMLWSPDHPHLYTLECDWLAYSPGSDGVFPQSTRFPFGFREIDWRAHEGFFLNGERLEIRGINRHEKMPGMGNALPKSMHREDARLIKELGLNAVRLSHYPQSPDFLDACDELGLLVYPEIATWKRMRRGPWLEQARNQLRRMIQRDGHHPSIICWGLGNESREATVYAELHAWAQALDPSRPTIYAENHLYRARRRKTCASTDIYGVNYELDPELLEEARDLSAKQVLLVSEMSNCPRWRGDIAGECEQIRVLEEDLEKIRERPYIAGFMLWCMNDYATMRKGRYRRPSGVFDAWRMPKFAAHYLRARLGTRPVLYAWADWGRVGASSREVHVFTNQSPLHFSVGDTCVEGVSGHTVVDLPFVDQALRIRAGEERFTIEPFGDPRVLDLSPEPYGEGIRILVRVLDAAGHPVLTAQGQATVRVDGPVLYHAWNAEGRIAITRGEGIAYVGVPGGEASVTVEMPGVASGHEVLRVPAE